MESPASREHLALVRSAKVDVATGVAAFNDAVEAVTERRRAQDYRWGPWRIFDPTFGLALVTEELGEAAKAILQHESIERQIDEWADVAATATAMIESLYLRQEEPS